MRAVARALALSVAAALAVAGCGGSGRPTLTVSAAASLTKAFSAYGRSFRSAAVRFSFGGSDLLAAQIRQGARPDVYAAANPTLPEALYAAHLVKRPIAFVSNRLVIAVPRGASRVSGLADLAKPGVKLVIGSPSVPVGAYTRTVLEKLGLTSVLSKVVSQETDVRAVTSKVALGQADAGFVYVTDARSVSDRVSVIRIPAWAQPRVRYEIAVVSKSSRKAAAQAWIKKLLSKKGQAVLARFGFLPLPPA